MTTRNVLTGIALLAMIFASGYGASLASPSLVLASTLLGLMVVMYNTQTVGGE